VSGSTHAQPDSIRVRAEQLRMMYWSIVALEHYIVVPISMSGEL